MIIWFFIQGDSLSVHRQTKLNFLTGNWPAVICHGYVLWKRCCSHWKQKRREERESSSKQNLIWGSFIKVFFHFIRAKEKKTKTFWLLGPRARQPNIQALTMNSRHPKQNSVYASGASGGVLSIHTIFPFRMFSSEVSNVT